LSSAKSDFKTALSQGTAHPARCTGSLEEWQTHQPRGAGMLLGFSFASLEELGSKMVTQGAVSKSKIFASSKVGRNGQCHRTCDKHTPSAG